MPAGLEIFNDSGSYVIDGEYVNPSVVRSGVGVFARESANSEDVVGQVRVPIFAGEAIAFASDALCGLAGTIDGYARIATENPNIGRTVRWWVFKMGDPGQTSDAGLQVWGEDGAKVFDSAWKILRVVTVAGVGAAISVPAGRQYAVIPSQVRMTVERSQSGSPDPQIPNLVTRRTLAEGVRIVSGVLTVEVGAILGQWARAYFPGGNTVPGWSGNFLNGLTTAYLVIDVTDY